METVKREIGKTTVTITKDLSQRLKIASAMKGIHIYQFTEMLLEEALEKIDAPTISIPYKDSHLPPLSNNLNIISKASNKKRGRGRPKKNGWNN